MAFKVDFKELIGYKDFPTLVQEAFQRLKSLGSLITNLNIGGVFRTLVELAMQGLADLHGLMLKVVPQGFVGYATGPWLDLHCEGVGIERHQASKAQGFVIFGRAQAGGNVRIPAGTIVKTDVSPSGEELRYFTTQDTILPEGVLEVAVPVRAEFEGARYNVGEGYIKHIVTYIPGIDYVRNAAGWITEEGRDTEEDDALRERYFLRWHELSKGATRYTYEAWAREVPGVVDVHISDQHPRGQGTVDVIISGPDGAPSQELINAVTAYIEERRPMNDNVLVKGPRLRVTDFVVTVYTDGDPDTVKQAAEWRIGALFSEIDDAIRPLRIGEGLPQARVVALMMGIERVTNVLVSAPQDITVDDDELITPGQISVTVLRG